MKRIAITGGIGSGKSYVCRLLSGLGIVVYDCDSAAKRLMRTSPELQSQLCDLIGPEAYLPGEDGLVLNKAAVAQFLLASEENARAIDAIVHPAVERDFISSGLAWIERLVDKVVVVTAPMEVRLQRVMARDGISRQKTLDWMNRQWPQEEVLRRADYEIINDGVQPLLPQIERIINQLNNNATDNPSNRR